MRLSCVERGDRVASKLMFVVVRVLSGFRLADVVRTLRYKAEWFGSHHAAHTQAVMRGPSEWSVGDRELFAAFVSRLNRCSF